MTSEIRHYGIKGQKWGIRRYQEADGSYTEAGKQRYIADKTKTQRKEIETFTSFKKTGIVDVNGKLMLSKEDFKFEVDQMKYFMEKRKQKLGAKWDRVTSAKPESSKGLKTAGIILAGVGGAIVLDTMIAKSTGQASLLDLGRMVTGALLLRRG